MRTGLTKQEKTTDIVHAVVLSHDLNRAFPDTLHSVHNSKRVYTKICTKSDALLDATQEISEVFVRALLQWRW